MLPGIGVTYNGEEIGMENGEVTWEEGQDPSACNGKKENFNKTSRDFERTPFHWDDSVNAGFNEGAKTWLPVSAKYHENNLAAQKADGVKSHFKIYQGLTALRKEDVLKYGNLKIFVASDNVLVVSRNLEEHKSYILVFNNANVGVSVDLNKTVPAFEKVTQFKVVVASIHSSRQKG